MLIDFDERLPCIRIGRIGLGCAHLARGAHDDRAQATDLVVQAPRQFRHVLTFRTDQLTAKGGEDGVGWKIGRIGRPPLRQLGGGLRQCLSQFAVFHRAVEHEPDRQHERHQHIDEQRRDQQQRYVAPALAGTQPFAPQVAGFSAAFDSLCHRASDPPDRAGNASPARSSTAPLYCATQVAKRADSSSLLSIQKSASKRMLFFMFSGAEGNCASASGGSLPMVLTLLTP